MMSDILLFFSGHENALPMYETLAERITREIPDVKIKVSQTQISFSNKRMFACASFLPVRKAKERPKDFLTVTFGLGYRAEDARIDAAVAPYPGRFTHHVLIGSVAEIDDQLLSWIREAAAFSTVKR